MTRDHRGFVFGLTAPQLQATWKFEAAQSELANAQRELAQAEQVLSDLTAQRAAWVDGGARSPRVSRLDPLILSRRLDFLAGLDQRIHDAGQQREHARQRRDQARQHCLGCQKTLQGLDDMCRDDLAVFLTARSQRDARRLDEDWLARQVGAAA